MQIQIKIVICLSLLMCSVLSAQQPEINSMKNAIGFELKAGYPSFNLDPLKEARDKGIASLKFPAKVTDDYPHIPYFQGEILYCISKYEFGFAFSFLTTGSRVHYADYSGEYQFNNIVSNYEYSAVIKTRSVDLNSPFRIQIAAEFGFATLSMKSDEFIVIKNQKQSNNNIFTNTITFVEFGLNGNYYLGNNFITSVGISYYAELEKEITIEFDGFRIHVGIGYRIPFGE